MNQPSTVIDLEEFRKRRSAQPAMAHAHRPATLWSPVWVWVMVFVG